MVRRSGVCALWLVGAAAAAASAAGMLHPGLILADFTPSIPMLRLTVGVTALGVPFLALLALLAFGVGLWSARGARPVDAALTAAFAGTMLLVLCSASVAMFFLAWEAMSLTSVFLVAAHHERRNVRRAAFAYLLVGQSGAACIVVALALLAAHAGDASFAAMTRAAATLAPGPRDAVFALAVAGFGSKAGLVPLHFWLPRAHPVAPANASALLSGAMLNVALYGLCSVAFVLAAPAPVCWAELLIVLGTLSAVVGIVYALIERDIKRLLAYSSVENVGIVVIGFGLALLVLSAGHPAAAAVALTAALFHAFNHGLFKALLFLGAGTIAESEETVDIERLGGLWRHLVWTAPAFLIGCAAIAGIPPFNGFASEWLLFRSLIDGLRSGDPAIALLLLVCFAALALAGGLALACFVKVFGIAFLGCARRTAAFAPRRERLDPAAGSLYVLALPCVAIGLIPAPAANLLAQIASATTGAPAAVPIPAAPTPTLAVLPFAGAALALALAAVRGVRAVPTWTCGSPVTAGAQYTATAFSKPLRTVFGFMLRPERERVEEGGISRWFPRRITYRTQSRYLVDETVRRLAALSLRLARRSQAVASGNLRLYVAYALGAVIFAVAVTVR